MLSGPRGDADLFPNLLWSICQPYHTAMSFLCTARTFHGATVNCLLDCPYHLIQSLPIAWCQAVQRTRTHTRAHAHALTHMHTHSHTRARTFHSYTHPGSFIKSLCAPVSLTEERKIRTSLWQCWKTRGNLRENSCSVAGFKRENENPSVLPSLRATQQF